MATETETAQAFPFHAHLCLDRLADHGPALSVAFTLGMKLFLDRRSSLAGGGPGRFNKRTASAMPPRHDRG